MSRTRRLLIAIASFGLGVFALGCFPITDDNPQSTDTDTLTDDYPGDSEGTDPAGTDDYDYQYTDLSIGELTNGYAVVLGGGTLAAPAPISAVVTIGTTALHSGTVAASQSPVWNERLGHGSTSLLAKTWNISFVRGGQAISGCTVDVTPAMVTRWGGFQAASCGCLHNLTVHFVPAR